MTFYLIERGVLSPWKQKLVLTFVPHRAMTLQRVVGECFSGKSPRPKAQAHVHEQAAWRLFLVIGTPAIVTMPWLMLPRISPVMYEPILEAKKPITVTIHRIERWYQRLWRLLAHRDPWVISAMLHGALLEESQ